MFWLRARLARPDVICTFGPHDRPFAERHHGVCVAAVTEGAFDTARRWARPCWRRGRCSSAMIATHSNAAMSTAPATAVSRSVSRPNFWKESSAAFPGVRRAVFSAPLLPPHSGLLPIIAAAEAAREDGDAAAFEEVALRLAGAVAAVLAGTKGRRRRRAAVTSGRSPPRCAGSKRRPTSRCRSPIWRTRRR